MNKEDVIPQSMEPDNNMEQDARLLFTCEQAMLRKKYPQPSVDTEWGKFRKETIASEIEKPAVAVQKKKSHKTRYFVLGSLSGIAATLLLVIGFQWQADKANQPIMIFTAEETTPQVTLGTDLQPQGVAIAEIKKEAAQNIIIKPHEVDFRQVAASPKYIPTQVITTPRGKDYQVILNDGTEVLLNAESKLTFPRKFTGSRRVVKLEGEAYFKIAKNEQMPFIVETERTSTRALGTEFNVKAYKNTESHVTLINGSVVVNMPEINKEVTLVPGQEVVVDQEVFKVKDVDVNYYVQWKDGYFYFDNVPLVEVLCDLGRWYNVNIEIEKPSLMSYRLHFIADRKAAIDEVVENLNSFSYLSAIKTGNKITIGLKK
ncbi:MAG TPA: FecR domain-containing protein [Bacteroides reticulotermitis]|nr:FecR domain-containing protein [Bacteroides reticulotermitis]